MDKLDAAHRLDVRADPLLDLGLARHDANKNARAAMAGRSRPPRRRRIWFGQGELPALNDFRAAADRESVTRGVGLVLVLLSLAVVGGGYALQSRSQGPTAAAATQEEAQATAAAASTTFVQVAEVLQADYAQAGTYVGAQLPVGSGVTLAQSTATTYCLEANLNGTLVHESGPGGSPALGPC